MRISHQCRRTPVYEPRYKLPIGEPGVVVEVASAFATATSQHALVDELKAHLLRQHSAHRTEIPGIDVIEARGERRSLSVGQRRKGESATSIRTRTQA